MNVWKCGEKEGGRMMMMKTSFTKQDRFSEPFFWIFQVLHAPSSAMSPKSHHKTRKGINLYKYEGKHALWSVHTTNYCEINDLQHRCVPLPAESLLTRDVHFILFDQLRKAARAS